MRFHLASSFALFAVFLAYAQAQRSEHKTKKSKKLTSDGVKTHQDLSWIEGFWYTCESRGWYNSNGATGASDIKCSSQDKMIIARNDEEGRLRGDIIAERVDDCSLLQIDPCPDYVGISGKVLVRVYYIYSTSYSRGNDDQLILISDREEYYINGRWIEVSGLGITDLERTTCDVKHDSNIIICDSEQDIIRKIDDEGEVTTANIAVVSSTIFVKDLDLCDACP